MGKKFLSLILLLSISISVVGCKKEEKIVAEVKDIIMTETSSTATSSEKAKKPKEAKIKTKEYELNDFDNNKFWQEEVFIDKGIIDTPKAIKCSDEYIYVTDYGDDKILKFDYNGNLVSEIGKTGNAPGEFDKPMAIAIENNILYVAEERTGRIQLFNKEDKVIKEIQIDYLEWIGNSILDIEVIDNKLYVALKAFEKKKNTIYVMDLTTNEVEKLDEEIIGFLGKNNNDIYASNFQSCEAEGKNMHYHSQCESYVAKINNLKTNKLFTCEDISICDFAFYKDNLYCVSQTFITVEKFDIEGNLICTIHLCPDFTMAGAPRGYRYMDIDKDGNIYLVDHKENMVYKLLYEE